MKKIISHFVLIWLVLTPMVHAQAPTASQAAPTGEDLYEYVESYYLEREISNELTPEELDELVQSTVADYQGSGDTFDEFFNPTFEESSVDDEIINDEFGNVACFDHYVFGSVQALIDTEVDTVVPGTNVVFKGELQNDNPYPLAEGSLYVKLFRVSDSETDENLFGNGPDVVDQFVALDDLTLPASGSVPVEFVWKAPAAMPSGEYVLATFFTTSDRYNLLGLSFTDDVVGNTLSFSVVNETDSRVFFEKDSVTVNEEPYFFAAFPPRTSPADPVTVSATLVNDTDEAVEVPVTYTLYEWDALRQENRVSIERENVTLAPGQNTVISHESAAADYPVYLLEMRVDWNGTKSLLNVRYVREGVDMPRINFPSLSNFPITAGEQTSMFSCLHNVGESVVPVSLKLVLSDKDGNVVSMLEKSGDLSSAMSAVQTNFVPDRGYDFLVLDAELSYGDEIVETERVIYDCNDFGSETCLSAAEKQVLTTEAAVKKSSFSWLLILPAVASVIVLIAVVLLVFNRKKEVPSEEEEFTTPSY